MSASNWSYESESGRYYVDWQDEYGRNTRRYSDEVYPESSSFDQAPSTQEYQKTPRSESSQRQKGRSATSSHHGSSTTRRSNTGRERKESESSSRRPEDIPEYEERSNPIPIRNASSSKKYHHSTGYNQPPREGYPAVDDHGPATAPSGFEATSSHHFSNSYNEAQDHDYVGSSQDPGLISGMNDLTIGDASPNAQYTFSKQHTGIPTTPYLDNRTQVQWPSTTSPDPGMYADSHQDKGKGVAMIQPGSQTPRPRYISGNRGNRENLDESYKVRNRDYKKWFRTGRVFSTLWTDPWGGPTNDEDSQFLSSVAYEVSFGEKVHSKIRRFVVVRLGDRCCTCLPVTTYAGRGYQKPGLKLDEHGLIYSSHKSPKPVNGITKEPLRVRLSADAEKITNLSYINYGRPYTVETNVKVKDVGELDSESRKLLCKYYNEVNMATDCDFPDQVLPRTDADRNAELTGMGGGVIGSAGLYSQPLSSAFEPVGPSTIPAGTHYSSSYTEHGSGWTSNSAFVSSGDSSFVPGSGYGSHTPQVVTSSITYSSNPVHSMNVAGGEPTASHDPRYSGGTDGTAPSSGQYPERDYDREYEHSTDFRSSRDASYLPVASSSGQYSSTPVASSSAWPAGPTPSAFQDPVIEEEESVVLPTLDEARASRSHRRHSTSQHGGSSRPHRGRERPRERERDRDERYDRRERDGYERR